MIKYTKKIKIDFVEYLLIFSLTTYQKISFNDSNLYHISNFSRWNLKLQTKEILPYYISSHAATKKVFCKEFNPTGEVFKIFYLKVLVVVILNYENIYFICRMYVQPGQTVNVLVFIQVKPGAQEGLVDRLTFRANAQGDITTKSALLQVSKINF